MGKNHGLETNEILSHAAVMLNTGCVSNPHTLIITQQ